MARPTLPILRREDGTLVFLVIHLFSGRRRATDCHARLMEWADRSGNQVICLSMDTAVSLHYGNLDAAAPAWMMLQRLFQGGYVSAVLSGAPCETFSEARRMAPPADLPPAEAQRWPRPLRSAASLFGLEGLTMKELRQVRQGSAFFMQNVEVMIESYVHGSVYIGEHPALPEDETRASIWRSPIVQLLRKHDAIHLHHISQWRWGAAAIKPTGLLAIGLPHFMRSMWARSTPEPVRPSVHAIGKQSDGSFRTSQFKEYPEDLSTAFAGAITDHFESALRSGNFHEVPFTDPALVQWVREAMEASSCIRTVSFLPDYQGG